MEKGNESAAIRFGVLKEILTRLEELTPDQYVAPEIAPEPDAHFVVAAPEDLKRLHTLRAMLMNEYEEIGMHAVKLMQEVRRYIETKGAAALEEESKMPNSRFSKLKAGVKRIYQKQRLKNHLVKIVNEMFWLEVKRQHADLQGMVDVCIYADWSLCWKESKGEIPCGLIGVIAIGHGDLEGVLERIQTRGRMH